MKWPKHYTLRGRKYKVIHAPNMVDYGDIQWPPRQIRIRLGMSEEDFLGTIIHECLHGCFGDLDEESVDEASTDIANVLLSYGYKRE